MANGYLAEVEGNVGTRLVSPPAQFRRDTGGDETRAEPGGAHQLDSG